MGKIKEILTRGIIRGIIIRTFDEIPPFSL